ncbi:MAG: hypothetical protein HZA34_02285 [Candidatus Pacebacteria bacterium]|nr:hypothetical protein [Candidatus Paceibacterota bacterium]
MGGLNALKTGEVDGYHVRYVAHSTDGRSEEDVHAECRAILEKISQSMATGELILMRNGNSSQELVHKSHVGDRIQKGWVVVSLR